MKMKNYFALGNKVVMENGEESIYNDALIAREESKMRHSMRRKNQRNKYAKRVKLFTSLWNGFSPEKIPSYAHALKSCSIPCKGWDNDEGTTGFRIKQKEKAAKKSMMEEFNEIYNLQEVLPEEKREAFERFLQNAGCYSLKAIFENEDIGDFYTID